MLKLNMLNAQLEFAENTTGLLRKVNGAFGKSKRDFLA